MYRKLMFLISFVALLTLVSVASAEDCEWIRPPNEPDDSFCNPANWDCGHVPGLGDEAYIDCGDGAGDITIDCDAEFGDLRGPAEDGDCNQNLDMVSGNILCESWEGITDGDNKVGIITVTGGTMTNTGDLRFAEEGDGGERYAYINIGGDAIISADGVWRNGDNSGNVFVDVSGDAVVTIGDYARIGDDGGGWWKFRGNCSVNFLGEYEDDKTGLQTGCRDRSVDLYMQDNAEVYVAYTLMLNKYSDSNGTAYVSGGTLNVNWLLMKQSSYLDMTGGVIICRDKLEIRNGAAAQVAGGEVQILGNDSLIIEDGGIMDITGGTLILTGNKITEISQLVCVEGRLLGYGMPAGIVMDYDVTNPGKTTVTAVEGPDPDQAYCPSPGNGETGVQSVVTEVLLEWTSGACMTDRGRHNVYFGEDCEALEYQGNVPGREDPNWVIGNLPLWTCYCWRIDEQCETGTTEGLVWSFCTGCELMAADTNLDCLVNFEDFACVAGTWMEEQLWP